MELTRSRESHKPMLVALLRRHRKEDTAGEGMERKEGHCVGSGGRGRREETATGTHCAPRSASSRISSGSASPTSGMKPPHESSRSSTGRFKVQRTRTSSRGGGHRGQGVCPGYSSHGPRRSPPAAQPPPPPPPPPPFPHFELSAGTLGAEGRVPTGGGARVRPETHPAQPQCPG